MKALIRAACLAGYVPLATSLGLDAARELRRVGLTGKTIADPEALIPYTALMTLLERSAEASGKPDFGLRLAAVQDMEMFGPLAILIRHAPTLGDAFRLAGRYAFVHSPAIRATTDPVEGRAGLVDLTFEIVLPNKPPCPQTLELSVALCIRIFRTLSGPRARAPVVLFPHARIGTPADYAKGLGCECLFSMPRAGLRVSAAELEQPLAEHNPTLQRMARNYLEQTFPQPERLLADQVRVLVRRFMGTGPLTNSTIAQALGMPPRTFQRRLANEGFSFEDIVNEVRRDRLRELIGRPDSPSLTQVAMMLGYSHQATLTRNCHRWFGHAPTQLLRNPELLSVES
ncbi:AraC family transcriptional regulator [Variovorax robiniae]|uniref:AraC family transcriptional regulator n=1 Tax=Variovorax robiniae TaxID=1836199 RepID=A0ABU8X7R0_9BURK